MENPLTGRRAAGLDIAGSGVAVEAAVYIFQLNIARASLRGDITVACLRRGDVARTSFHDDWPLEAGCADIARARLELRILPNTFVDDVAGAGIRDESRAGWSFNLVIDADAAPLLIVLANANRIAILLDGRIRGNLACLFFTAVVMYMDLAVNMDLVTGAPCDVDVPRSSGDRQLPRATD